MTMIFPFASDFCYGNHSRLPRIYPYQPDDGWRRTMGRYLLLWLLGIPLPILVLIYAFGGLH